MTHGVPDWGLTNCPKNVYQVLEMGELAARLGSIDSFDRRGDIVFMDSFEDGLVHWVTGGVGTGHDVRLTRRRSRSGAYAAKMVAGSTLIHQAWMWHQCPLAFWSPTGAEVSFALPDAIDYFVLALQVQDPPVQVSYAIRYDYTTKRLLYLNPADAWTPFATGVPDFLDPDTFQTMKLVANPQVQKYARLQLNSVTYDLSSYAPYVVAAAGAPWISLQIWLFGAGATNPALLVDDAIITQNEQA
jgi:hypothetical protein